jgi:DNA polymerase-3 subunit alpha
MKFVSFHTHSTFSYGDGFGTVRQHVERVTELGMTALALSEHGNVNSHAALERECRTAGIKSIFGIEAYFSPPNEKRKFHITLFAQNEEGYLNLNKIVTQSYLDTYQYPTVLWENLVKNSTGIIAFSGCSDSLISCTLLGGKSLGEKRLEYTEQQYAKTRQRVEQFQDVFAGRFYLEVQRFPELARTCVLNPTFAQLSTETGAQLVATADVHYPLPSQNTMQTVLHAARRSSTVAISEAEWEYNILLTYPKTDEEIKQQLIKTGLSEYEAYCAIDNTRILAEDSTVELPKAAPLRFPLPSGHTSSRNLLKQRIRNGLYKRIKSRPDIDERMADYKQRINHEFKIIADKDFCDYFLVVADLVEWAKEQGITVGPGRGSAAGSVICYLLGITEIDPLYSVFDKMVFERFIDPNRSDMPDIDLDFDDTKRYRIAERAREIYGQENVANVANHIKYRGRKALQDVARAHGMALKTFDAIAQKCAIRVETDERVDSSITDTIESFSTDHAIASLVDQYGDIIYQAIQLEGNQHSMGIHAGGFVIASDPIPNVCAIYNKYKGTGRNREIAQVIPYEKRDAEYLGMLKMDFLGLTTCGMLGLCLEWSGVSLEKLYSMFYNEHSSDNNVTHGGILRHFRDDDVAGIFQYEGGTTRQVVRDVAPDNFDELAACGALSRPGPFYGGQTADYIAVKKGEKDWERIHPGFDKHVEWTYGQIVYQEQIMWILRDLAGFSTEKVLQVRKIIGKKLGEFQFSKLWWEFRDGCIANGVTADDSERVWRGITTAAGYAFNTAHAYSYALVAWWQMWFKINYPAVFYAATLAKNGDGKDDLARRISILKDAIEHEVKILAVDPNCSTITWRPDLALGGAIRPGLSQIDGIGEATAADIVAWRGTRPGWDWVTWDDISAVKGVGAKTIQRMKDFVSQDDPFCVYKTENQLGDFREQMRRGEFESFGLPNESWFYRSDELPQSDQYAAFVGLVANIVFRDEVETIRTRTGKPVDQILSELDFPDKTRKATIFAYDERGEVALRVSRFVYPSVESKATAIKPDYHVVVGYGRTFKDRPNCLQVKQLWVLDPD